MTGRHVEKTVEMSSLKTKEGHKRGPGDANSRKENGNFTKQMACFL